MGLWSTTCDVSYAMDHVRFQRLSPSHTVSNQKLEARKAQLKYDY